MAVQALLTECCPVSRRQARCKLNTCNPHFSSVQAVAGSKFLAVSYSKTMFAAKIVQKVTLPGQTFDEQSVNFENSDGLLKVV